MTAKRKTEIRNNRLDHRPGVRQEYERHKKRILATETICGICGQPVDKSLKYPDPGSPTIDHIVPLSRGGHPSSLENLQLAHFRCNRLKFNRLLMEEQSGQGTQDKTTLPPGKDMSPAAGLPWTIDWTAYRCDENTDDKTNVAILWEQAKALKAKGLSLCINGVMRIR